MEGVEALLGVPLAPRGRGPRPGGINDATTASDQFGGCDMAFELSHYVTETREDYIKDVMCGDQTQLRMVGMPGGLQDGRAIA
jgi:hypothetical protein